MMKDLYPDAVPKESDESRPLNRGQKLFQVLKSSVQWGDLQNIETVGALNDMVTKYDMREIVLVQEAYQERQIAEIAAQIAAKPETKLVMIAGPSSSGKTTFSHRLSIQLRTQGMQTASDRSGQLFCGSGKNTPG